MKLSKLFQDELILVQVFNVFRCFMYKHPTNGQAFSKVAPVLWNSLPVAPMCIDSFESFKAKLKTRLFDLYLMQRF